MKTEIDLVELKTQKKQMLNNTSHDNWIESTESVTDLD